MLQKDNMLAVNQINVQIKLTEIWKAVNDPDHPFKIEKPCIDSQKITTREIQMEYLKFMPSLISQKEHLSMMEPRSGTWPQMK